MSHTLPKLNESTRNRVLTTRKALDIAAMLEQVPASEAQAILDETARILGLEGR